MAAILCKSLCDLCTALGDLICVPCRACGWSCRFCIDAICGPFFPYLALTYLLNIPACMLGLQRFTDVMRNYCPIGSRWLVLNGALVISHIIGASYIVYRIREDSMSEYNQSLLDNAGGGVGAGSVGRGSMKSSSPTSGVSPTESAKQRMWDDLDPIEAGRLEPVVPVDAVVTGIEDRENKKAKGVDGGEDQYVVPPGAAISATVVADPQGYTRTTTTTHIPSPQNKQQPFTTVAALNDGSSPRMSWGRVQQVLCHDRGVAIYIVVAILWMVWQSMGLTSIFTMNADYVPEGDEDGQHGCDSEIQSHMAYSLALGWVYMSLVAFGFMCSLCCLRF